MSPRNQRFSCGLSLSGISVCKFSLTSLLVFFFAGLAYGEAGSQSPTRKVVLKVGADNFPTRGVYSSAEDAQLRVVAAFREKYPHILPESSKGLQFPSLKMKPVETLMQIAGDIAPDILEVNLEAADTYIQNRFLYPLDKYVEEEMLGLALKDAHLLELGDYTEQLKKSPFYAEEIKKRFPEQCWELIRQECPYGEDCPYCKAWGTKPAKKHYHIWAFPYRMERTGIYYRRDMFYQAGLPDRAPETLEEMLEFARKLTDPEKDKYGLNFGWGTRLLGIEGLGKGTLSILYSYGGRLVDKDENGNLICVFDSEEAVEAYYFVARLFLEPFTNARGKKLHSVVFTEEIPGRVPQLGMRIFAFTSPFLTEVDTDTTGFGAVPGKDANSEPVTDFSCRMMGIYAGLEEKKDESKRDAAWDYIAYQFSRDARKIRAKTFVENGDSRYVAPYMLREAGYLEHAKLFSGKFLDDYSQIMTSDAAPQPYGKNCSRVFSYVSKAIDQIRTDATIKEAIISGNEKVAKDRIRKILKGRVANANEKMLNRLSPKEFTFRKRVATAVAATIFVIFILVFRKVFRTFADAQVRDPFDTRRGWQFGRYKWCYLLLIPAVGSIALWRYYPLLRGSVMAFQDYNIRGFSEWIGVSNFANVLFDPEFWFAMWISFKYALMFAVFGFTAPIILAFLLTEVPRGKILFRTIYYLPAVLSGVVVIFLWKSFYGQFGMINSVLNSFIGLLNIIPGVAIEELHKAWLSEPSFALFFLLVPTVWAGMGPGCLIYLAALKTIPEEIYEAADIDGAGMFRKAFNIAIPNIKPLIMINFIGVMVGVMKSGGALALAMTGGGPYTPYGQTEVVGLQIYWQAFGYLRFGAATAMAWVLGSLLVGFTVLQLQRLSKVEFKTAGGVA